MRIDGLHPGKGRAGKTQQVLPDLEVEHLADVDVVLLEQVEDVAHVPGVGVLKGQDAGSDLPRVHGLEDLLERGVGDGLATGEEVLLRDVRVRALRAEVAHRPPPMRVAW